MRSAFVTTLVELAAEDPRILLLTGDLGYMALEPFSERYPDRFFNVGVAEQNMIGVATGLAEAGYIPFVYSIVTFAVLRPYEFIRNGPVFHQLPVRIVGVGGGLEYGQNGISHYGLEDVGVLRLQPGLSVICPADHQQTRSALRQTWDLPGPVYYRLGKDEKTTVPGLDGQFTWGGVQHIREGNDTLIIAMGAIAIEAAAAAELLAANGVQCTVLVAAAINPPPITELAKVLGRFRLAFTLEAHYITGGLGSLVAEVIAEHGLDCRLVRFGLKNSGGGISGSQDYLYGVHGLRRDSVASNMLHEMRIGQAGF